MPQVADCLKFLSAKALLGITGHYRALHAKVAGTDWLFLGLDTSTPCNPHLRQRSLHSKWLSFAHTLNSAPEAALGHPWSPCFDFL